MKKLTLPWSKSITNRDLILASLSSWKTVLDWVLVSDDTRHMIRALKDLWIKVEDNGTRVSVEWGVEKLLAQEIEIYLGQSGTCMRFLPALACLLTKWEVTFVWDERLMERPLGALISWIEQLWIEIDNREGGLPPIVVRGGKITNNVVKMDGSISSQFFTALMNIGGFIEWWLEIEVVWDLVSKPYIDMTILELSKFGISVENKDYQKFIVGVVDVQSKTDDRNITIEWDGSALSYIANYIVLNGWRIEITNLWNITKQGDYQYLELLKSYFWLDYSSDWKTTILKAWGIDKMNLNRLVWIDFEDMPDVSMSFMSLAIFLPGETKITWLKTLNLKECKRIDAMRDELIKLWIEVKSDEDSISIGEYRWKKWWKWIFGIWGKIKIETYNDHRIAMTFWVLETYLKERYKEKIKILNPDCVNKTYPNFWTDLEFLWETEDILKIS